MRRSLPRAPRSFAPQPVARRPLPRRRAPGVWPERRRHTRRARAEAARPLFAPPRAPPQPGAEAWSISKRAQFCGSGGSHGDAARASPRPRAGPGPGGAAGWGAGGVGRGEGPPLRPCPVSALIASLLLFSSLPSKPDPVAVLIRSLSLPLPSLADWGLGGCGPRCPHRVRGEEAGEGRLGGMGRTAEGVSEALKGLSPSLGQEGDMALAQDWMGRGWLWEEALGRRSEGRLSSGAQGRRGRGESSQSPAPSQNPGMRKVSDFVTLAAKGLRHLG